MPFLVNDTIETLEMEEINGVIRSLTRRGVIGGLRRDPGIGVPAKFDYKVLLDAYKQVGLPDPGSYLTNTIFPLGPGPADINQAFSQLTLSKRSFKLLADPDHVAVTLKYEHFIEGENQTIGGQGQLGFTSPNGWTVPDLPVIYGKNRASVQQAKSNFIDSFLSLPNGQPVPAWSASRAWPAGAVVDYSGFYWAARVAIPANKPPPPAGIIGFPVAQNGARWRIAVEGFDVLPLLTAPIRREVVVGHQFPGQNDLNGYPPDPNLPGQTRFQTGEFTTMQPNENFKLRGQMFIANPRTVKDAILGAINSIPWNDGNAYEWMCTEVSWEPIYVGWQYAMSFEFQHNPDTWLPTAIYNDQRYGRPPVGVIEGFGVRQLHKHPEVDFNAFFLQALGVPVQ